MSDKERGNPPTPGGQLRELAEAVRDADADWCATGCQVSGKEWVKKQSAGRALQARLVVPGVAIIAALDAEREAATPQWQPIETAPDGVWVLVHACDRLGRVRVAQRRGAEWSDREGRIVDPTHWQPLPEPPK